MKGLEITNLLRYSPPNLCGEPAGVRFLLDCGLFVRFSQSLTLLGATHDSGAFGTAGFHKSVLRMAPYSGENRSI
jgi:hypothetical protein